ncbi:hypothetical protein [Halosimplex marinum]|uniref:hypothetical protein n=1 Tax=Halosimplex marinum TaxID=3396620 RepID=UPI003F556B75
MNRRRFLVTTTLLGTLGITAGCSENNVESNVEIPRINYSISKLKTHEEIPDEVIEHPNPDGFRWIVVKFERRSGSIDATDILGLTQVSVSGTTAVTRAVRITTPEEVLVTDSEESHMMEEGTQGNAYYRVSSDAESGDWVVEQLENQHSGIQVQQHTATPE